jgi:hypothetical protein
VGSNPTPSANCYSKLLICNYIYYRVLRAPHFIPHLFCVVICLEIFEKTGGFDGIDGIGVRKRPFRPSSNRVQ